MPNNLPARRNPYVGPRAFRSGETLYGRDREVRKLLDLLIAERIVLLYSPSGAGKTSLIQAALVPALEQEEFKVLPIIRVGLELPPTLKLPEKPNRYLINTLLSLNKTVVEIQALWPGLAMMELSEYLDKILSQTDKSSVLIFDQFEEILTLDSTDRPDKQQFFEQVGKALRNRDRWALFAMQEDYIAGLDPYLRSVPTQLRTTFRLELLGAAEAQEAIQKPALQVGVDFTDAAAKRLVDNLRQIRVSDQDDAPEEKLGPYIEPLQLQVVCLRLWDRLNSEQTVIEEGDIGKLGDVDTALSDYYAEQVKAIADTLCERAGVKERDIRRWFERQLITKQKMRGQVLKDPKYSQGLNNLAIQLLVQARLVRSERRCGVTWYELTHDRLIKPILKNNYEWREANLSLLQQQAKLWDKENRPIDLLLEGKVLEEAERWAEDNAEDLTEIDQDFLRACREHERVRTEMKQKAEWSSEEIQRSHQMTKTLQQQLEQERQRSRKLAITTTISIVIAIIAFIVASLH